MATFFEDRDRRVIPNFRSLKITEKLGDLKSSKKDQTKSLLKDPHFDKLSSEWSNNINIGYAADLLSTGLLVNPDNDSVKSAAEFVLKSNESSTSQKSLAFHILGKELETVNSINKNLQWFIDYNRLPSIYSRISALKKQIIEFPKNSLNYTEISRLYLIIGEEDRAKEYMKKALYFGYNNRYVLRSAVRLFVHFDELDLPHSYLRKYSNIKNDPWLLSAEIALSTLRNRNSKFIKNGLSILDSNKHTSFSTTELSAAIGTVELFNGTVKKTKKLFLKSLECPNDNSLAQVEWATNKDRLFNLNPNDFNNVSNKYEALSMDFYHNQDWEETLKNSEKWFLDSPFSKAPTMLGSHVALAYLDLPERSIDFCKAGLISHPNDPQLINNISYSYGLLNDTENADFFLNKIQIESIDNLRTKNCLLATKGLIEFRKKNIEEGRFLYSKVIDQTKKDVNKRLNYLAILNLAREELTNDSTKKEFVNNLINKIDVSSADADVRILKDKIFRTIN